MHTTDEENDFYDNEDYSYRNKPKCKASDAFLRGDDCDGTEQEYNENGDFVLGDLR
jgi:hypothetical protein